MEQVVDTLRGLRRGWDAWEMKMRGGTMRRINVEKPECGRDARGRRKGAQEGHAPNAQWCNG
jgi:hypothetical protein